MKIEFYFQNRITKNYLKIFVPLCACTPPELAPDDLLRGATLRGIDVLRVLMIIGVLGHLPQINTGKHG